MKNLIEYNFSCCNAFFKYLKDKDLEVLISTLKDIENKIKADNNLPLDCEESLWFRFHKHDTLATTIKNIESTLSLYETHNNKKLLLEEMADVCGLDMDCELQVYFS